ncbi:hypothetical protein WAI453_005656 [Rhynchosporium graminicola]
MIPRAYIHGALGVNGRSHLGYRVAMVPNGKFQITIELRVLGFETEDAGEKYEETESMEEVIADGDLVKANGKHHLCQINKRDRHY